MTKLLKALVLKIRLWNPRYFINPFYSPSLAGIEFGKKMLKYMVDGIEGRITRPISIDTWEQIERSARAVFLFDDDAEL